MYIYICVCTRVYVYPHSRLFCFLSLFRAQSTLPLAADVDAAYDEREALEATLRFLEMERSQMELDCEIEDVMREGTSTVVVELSS